MCSQGTNPGSVFWLCDSYEKLKGAEVHFYFSMCYRVQCRLLPLSAGLCERMSSRLLGGLPASQLHRGKLYGTSFRPSLPALPTALPDLQQPQPSVLSVLPPAQLPGPQLWHLPAS